MLQPDVYVVKSIQVFLTNGDVEIHNIAIERAQWKLAFKLPSAAYLLQNDNKITFFKNRYV